MTINAYQQEVEDIFNRPSVASGPVLKCASTDATLDFINHAIRSVLSPDWSDFSNQADLFSLGLDSLKVAELVKTINYGLKSYAAFTLDAKTIYQMPTVQQLSAKVLTGISPNHNRLVEPVDGTIKTQLSKFISKYAPWPSKFERPGSIDQLMTPVTQQTIPDNGKFRITLTGSTGLLDGALLKALLRSTRVEAIYCLTRSIGPESKRGACDGPAIIQVKVDFFKEKLGLPDTMYYRMLASVNVILHTAWAVDFNLALQSYEDSQFYGLRSLIGFSLSSKLSVRPRIIFTSSTSYAFDWAVANKQVQIPEKIIDVYDDTFGTGYGQSEQVAEHVLSEASHSYELPVTVLRIGQIIETSMDRREIFGKEDWIFALVNTSESLSAVPSTSFLVDWIYVNDIAHIILDILVSDTIPSHSPDIVEGQESNFTLYKIVNPQPIPWKFFTDAVQESLQISQIITLREWFGLMALSQSEDKTDHTNMVSRLPALKMYHFFESLAMIDERYQVHARFEIARSQGSSKTIANLQSIDMALLGCLLGV